MKKYIGVLSLSVLIVLILNFPMFERFTVLDGKTGKIAYADEVDNVGEFVVSFRHSVNRTPVNEFIRIQGNKFMVHKTTFYSYGAGMPESDESGRQKVTINNGLVQIENIDRELSSFAYIVGTYADHTLSYKGKSLRLSEYVKPQNPAFFCIKKITPIELAEYFLRRK